MPNVTDTVSRTARRHAQELRANDENLMSGDVAKVSLNALAAFVAALLRGQALPDLNETVRADKVAHARGLIGCLRSGANYFGPTDSAFAARALDFYSVQTG